MIAAEVLKNARYKLSDTNPQRWTDERLLSLLNDGLTDIAKTTILFIDTIFIELVNEQTDYDLSSFAFKIIRVEYEDKPLAVSSFSEMDKKIPLWQQAEGEKLKAYIIDKQREANFKLYPKLTNATMDNIDFGGNFGIITGVTYSELEFNMSDDFGDLGEVEEDGFIKVFYVRKHPKITDINDTLYISSVAEEPLAHYIAGHALRDNQDTQNRAFGNEEIGLYKQQLEEYSLEKSKNFSQAQFAMPYRPMGD